MKCGSQLTLLFVLIVAWNSNLALAREDHVFSCDEVFVPGYTASLQVGDLIIIDTPFSGPALLFSQFLGQLTFPAQIEDFNAHPIVLDQEGSWKTVANPAQDVIAALIIGLSQQGHFFCSTVMFVEILSANDPTFPVDPVDF